MTKITHNTLIQIIHNYSQRRPPALMPIYRAFNVCLENQEFFRELGGVGTYVQEDNSVLVKSGTMGIGWGVPSAPIRGMSCFP